MKKQIGTINVCPNQHQQLAILEQLRSTFPRTHQDKLSAMLDLAFVAGYNAPRRDADAKNHDALRVAVTGEGWGK